MPQATPDLRRVIEKQFGTLDAGPVLAYLLDHGWRDNHGELIEPEGKKWSQCTPLERQCAIFLIEEWDFA